MSTLFSRHRISRILYLDTESKQVFYLVITKRVCSFVRSLFSCLCVLRVCSRVCSSVRCSYVLWWVRNYVRSYVNSCVCPCVANYFQSYVGSGVCPCVRNYVRSYVKVIIYTIAFKLAFSRLSTLHLSICFTFLPLCLINC